MGQASRNEESDESSEVKRFAWDSISKSLFGAVNCWMVMLPVQEHSRRRNRKVLLPVIERPSAIKVRASKASFSKMDAQLEVDRTSGYGQCSGILAPPKFDYQIGRAASRVA